MKKQDKHTINLDDCTFGMEIEIGGADRTAILPEGNKWCTKEGSVINDKGISNDPKAEYCLLGGEIQVKPAKSEDELVLRALSLIDIIKAPAVTVPSTMHIHIYVPDFHKPENLQVVKDFMMWNQKWYPEVGPMISKLPPMSHFTKDNYPNPLCLKQVLRAFKDKYRSRHSIFSKGIEDKILESTHDTVTGMINSFAPQNKKGDPMWNIFRRTGVNFKKLRSGDLGTIEFRMFTATEDPELLRNIIEFPKKYIECFLRDGNPVEEFKDTQFPEYCGWLDDNEEYALNHLYTDSDKLKRPEIVEFLKGKLLSKELLLSDLGYPPFWLGQLGMKYYELEEYSKSMETK